MHTYSIDTDERSRVIFGLVTISILMFWYCNHLITVYDVPSIINVPTPFVIFGVLYLIFDNFLWKFKIFSLVVKTPNLIGVWDGQYISSYKGVVIPAKLKIKQTWTKIEIISENGETQSNSSMAGIFTKCGGEISLKFEYNNNSNICMEDNRPSHSGFSHLIFDKAEKKFRGSYYNDKNRQTFGSASFTYISKTKD